jgi:hypothetical protein
MTAEHESLEPWYAVRCVFRTTENKPWGPTDLTTGTSAYEERITLWRASSADEAIARAELEANEHAAILGDQYVDFAQAYHLTDLPADGGEVFSLIRYSSLETDAFLDHFFDSGEERQQQFRE